MSALPEEIRLKYGGQKTLFPGSMNWYRSFSASGIQMFSATMMGKRPHFIQINFAEEGIPRMTGHPDIEKHGRYTADRQDLQWCPRGSTWLATHPYWILPEGTRFRYLRVTAVELPYGSRFSISGLRVFGVDDGEKPDRKNEL